VLQFNLASTLSMFDTTIGAGRWTLLFVGLQLNPTAPNDPIFNTSADGRFGISWMQNDSWTEGTGTPAAPGASGITFATSFSARAPSRIPPLR